MYSWASSWNGTLDRSDTILQAVNFLLFCSRHSKHSRPKRVLPFWNSIWWDIADGKYSSADSLLPTSDLGGDASVVGYLFLSSATSPNIAIILPLSWELICGLVSIHKGLSGLSCLASVRYLQSSFRRRIENYLKGSLTKKSVFGAIYLLSAQISLLPGLPETDLYRESETKGYWDGYWARSPN